MFATATVFSALLVSAAAWEVRIPGVYSVDSCQIITEGSSDYTKSITLKTSGEDDITAARFNRADACTTVLTNTVGSLAIYSVVVTGTGEEEVKFTLGNLAACGEPVMRTDCHNGKVVYFDQKLNSTELPLACDTTCTSTMFSDGYCDVYGCAGTADSCAATIELVFTTFAPTATKLASYCSSGNTPPTQHTLEISGTPTAADPATNTAPCTACPAATTTAADGTTTTAADGTTTAAAATADPNAACSKIDGCTLCVNRPEGSTKCKWCATTMTRFTDATGECVDMDADCGKTDFESTTDAAECFYDRNQECKKYDDLDTKSEACAACVEDSKCQYCSLLGSAAKVIGKESIAGGSCSYTGPDGKTGCASGAEAVSDVMVCESSANALFLAIAAFVPAVVAQF